LCITQGEPGIRKRGTRIALLELALLSLVLSQGVEQPSVRDLDDPE
jgi:hypothetical protein